MSEKKSSRKKSKKSSSGKLRELGSDSPTSEEEDSSDGSSGDSGEEDGMVYSSNSPQRRRRKKSSSSSSSKKKKRRSSSSSEKRRRRKKSSSGETSEERRRRRRRRRERKLKAKTDSEEDKIKKKLKEEDLAFEKKYKSVPVINFNLTSSNVDSLLSPIIKHSSKIFNDMFRKQFFGVVTKELGSIVDYFVNLQALGTNVSNYQKRGEQLKSQLKRTLIYSDELGHLDLEKKMENVSREVKRMTQQKKNVLETFHRVTLKKVDNWATAISKKFSERINSLRSDLQKEKELTKKLKEKLNDPKEKEARSVLNNKASSLKQENIRLKSILKSEERKITIQQQFSNSETSFEFQKTIDTLKVELEEITKRRNKLEKKKTKLKELLQISSLEIDQLKGEVVQKEIETDRITIICKKMRDENRGLKILVKKTEMQQLGTVKELNSIKTEDLKLKNEVNILSKKIMENTSNNSKKLLSLEREIRESTKVVSSLMEKNDKIQKVYNSFSNSSDMVDSHCQNVSSSCQRLENDVHRMKLVCQKITKSNEHVKQKMQESLKVVETLRSQNSSLKEYVKSLLQKINQFENVSGLRKKTVMKISEDIQFLREYGVTTIKKFQSKEKDNVENLKFLLNHVKRNAEKGEFEKKGLELLVSSLKKKNSEISQHLSKCFDKLVDRVRYLKMEKNDLEGKVEKGLHQFKLLKEENNKMKKFLLSNKQ